MEPGRSVAPALFAALVPVGTILGAALALGGLLGPQPAATLFAEAGFFGWAVLAGASVAVLALIPLLVLIALGRKVPSGLAFGVALLPWAVGVVGMRVGMSATLEAAALGHPASRSAIALTGMAETLSVRVLGAWASSALLVAVALGLALGAAARRPQNRGLLGALGVLPAALLAFAAVAMTPLVGTLAMVLFLLPAVGFAVAVGLGGASAGREEGRPSTPLPLVAAVAGGLGFLAAAAAAGGLSLRSVAGTAALADQVDRAAHLVQHVPGFAAVKLLGWGGLGLSAVACAWVGGWAVARARPNKVAPAGAWVAVALALLAFGGDRLVLLATLNEAAEATGPRWQRSREVDLPDTPLPRRPVQPQWVVAPDGSQSGPVERDGEVLAVAADARAGASAIRALAQTALAAGAERVLLATERAPVTSAPAEMEALLKLAQLPLGVELWLLSPREQQAALADPVLFHASLGGGPVTVRARAGSRYGAFPLEEPPPFKEGVVYLGLTEQTTVQQVVDAAARLEAAGFRAVLATGEVPGQPERALGGTE